MSHSFKQFTLLFLLSGKGLRGDITKKYDLLINNGSLVFYNELQQEITQNNLGIKDGLIIDIGSLADDDAKKVIDATWGIDKQIVDVIGSDHAPYTLDEKRKTYPQSPTEMP